MISSSGISRTPSSKATPPQTRKPQWFDKVGTAATSYLYIQYLPLASFFVFFCRPNSRLQRRPSCTSPPLLSLEVPKHADEVLKGFETLLVLQPRFWEQTIILEISEWFAHKMESRLLLLRGGHSKTGQNVVRKNREMCRFLCAP